MPQPPNLDRFPGALKVKRRWVTWRSVDRNGKSTKVPQQRVDAPEEWLELAEACARVAAGNADGIGYVLGDGVVGIDLDHVIGDDGTLHEIAEDAIALGSYTEVSPSGRGIHVLLRATVARSRNIRGAGTQPSREIYDANRYFTVTGERIGDETKLAGSKATQAKLDAFLATWFAASAKPKAPRDHARAASSDDDVLAIMFKERNGTKWRALFAGDWSGYPSQSEADLALCRKLRFYALADYGTIDRLFRRSGLVRAKWDEVHGAKTYGDLTIAKALAKGGHVYKGERPLTRSTVRAPDAFLIFPTWVNYRLKGAGELAFRVYNELAGYADAETRQAYPTIEALAANCGVSLRPVKAAIAKLVEHRVVFVTRRPRSSNLYYLPRTVMESDTLHDVKRGGAQRKKGDDFGTDSDPQPRSILLDKQTIVDTAERDQAQTENATERKDAGMRASEPNDLRAPTAIVGKPKSQICAFHTGYVGKRCERCGASWVQHYPRLSEAGYESFSRTSAIR